MKVGFIPVLEAPKIIDIQPDENGSYSSVLQFLVGGGFLEAFTPLYGEHPCLYINDNGLYECPLNRAVYANKRMVEHGYLAQLSQPEGEPRRVVKENELYTLLCGNIVAVSQDFTDDGELVRRDITTDEFNQLFADFKNVYSGHEALMAYKYKAQHQK